MVSRSSAKIALYLCLIGLLSACSSSKTIQSFRDVPLHPQAKVLDISYFLSHPLVGPGWTMTDQQILGGPYAGYQVEGQGTYSVAGQSPAPSLEDFYDTALKGWTKQTSTATDEFTGIKSTLLTWSNAKQVVVVFTYLDEAQTNLTIFLLKGQ